MEERRASLLWVGLVHRAQPVWQKSRPGFLAEPWGNRESVFELTAKQKKIQCLATAREAAAAARQASFQRLHRHAALGTTEHGAMKQCLQGQGLLTT